MKQAWFNLSGIGCDMVGFLLIAYEWRLAAAPLKLRQLENKISEFTNIVGRGSHLRFSNEDRRRHDELLAKWGSQVEVELRNSTSDTKRLKLFEVGAALVFLGYIFQFIGNVPLAN